MYCDLGSKLKCIEGKIRVGRARMKRREIEYYSM